MKYTVSREADKKIDQDIQVIKSIILKHWKPKAIVLFGGFGHGGGSFKKRRNKIIPLNDYDFYIISKKQIIGKKLERVGEECSKALGRGGLEIVERYNEKWDEDEFFHVDLHNLTTSNLKNPYPTQRTFDLKTSMVIYGDKNILDKIPDIKISKSDALRLLFNKLDHFAISENNSEMLRKIYAVKGLTDSCTALLIFYNNYTSKYQDRIRKLDELKKYVKIPEEYIKLVEIATDSKLKKGYEIKNTEKFFNESKEWVEWVLKHILTRYLKINSEEWEKICGVMYKKIPYMYFNDYTGSKYLFLGQYYLNIKFFLEGVRKGEFLPRSLMGWRDVGLIVAISLILYSFGHEDESRRYIGKLTKDTKKIKERILRLYSIYYLQKFV